MGTRSFYPSMFRRHWDHPHAYGDKRHQHSSFRTHRGSSPRVWGQGGFLVDWDSSLRIIPTRMGTSLIPRLAYTAEGDHPHAYGDKRAEPRTRKTRMGSSPRVWGQVTIAQRRNSARRIIPTRMGTSCAVSTSSFIMRDHPHAYGDKYIKSTMEISLLGSSPRVWGQG